MPYSMYSGCNCEHRMVSAFNKHIDRIPAILIYGGKCDKEMKDVA